MESDKTSLWQALAIFSFWILLSLLLTLPRITHPAYGIQGDLTLHYHITRSYTQSLSEGDLMPRWAGLLDGGRGDALFTFYPPLSYLLSAAIIKISGISTLTSLMLVSVIMLVIAQFSSYRFGREFFDRRRSLLISSAFIVLPAYPLLALHRAFFANGLALALTPLALLGAYRLLTGVRIWRGLLIFLFSLSAIVLTHAITTYLTVIAIGIMSLTCIKRAGWRGFVRTGLAGLYVLCMTAFFLWPQVIERDWVQLGLQVVQQDYRSYFLFAKPYDSERYRQAWANVNFVTSLMIIVQTLTAAVFFVIARRNSLLHRKTNDDKNPKFPLVLFCLILVIFSIFISLSISEPLWRYLPGLKFIQFPWRIQPFVALCTGLLAAAALENRHSLRRRPRTLVSALLTWLLIANIIFTVMFVRINEPEITREQVAGWLESAEAEPVTIEEGRRLQNESDLKYLPYTANQIYFRPPGSQFILFPPADQPGGASITEGEGHVTTNINDISHREYRLENQSPVRVKIDTHNYPHWVARLDGNEIKIETEPATGLILVNAPQGSHTLTLDFEPEILSQKIASAVSLVAWLIFIVFMLIKLPVGARFR